MPDFLRRSPSFVAQFGSLIGPINSQRRLFLYFYMILPREQILSQQSGAIGRYPWHGSFLRTSILYRKSAADMPTLEIVITAQVPMGRFASRPKIRQSRIPPWMATAPPSFSYRKRIRHFPTQPSSQIPNRWNCVWYGNIPFSHEAPL